MAAKWPVPHCSFCGKSAIEVAQLITGMNGAAICGGCIEEAAGLLAMTTKAHAYDALMAPWFDPDHPMNKVESRGAAEARR